MSCHGNDNTAREASQDPVKRPNLAIVGGAPLVKALARATVDRCWSDEKLFLCILSLSRRKHEKRSACVCTLRRVHVVCVYGLLGRFVALSKPAPRVRRILGTPFICLPSYPPSLCRHVYYDVVPVRTRAAAELARRAQGSNGAVDAGGGGVGRAAEAGGKGPPGVHEGVERTLNSCETRFLLLFFLFRSSVLTFVFMVCVSVFVCLRKGRGRGL